jgi:hypothetical protein
MGSAPSNLTSMSPAQPPTQTPTPQLDVALIAQVMAAVMVALCENDNGMAAANNEGVSPIQLVPIGKAEGLLWGA